MIFSKPFTVLFLSTGNAARSILAEALLREHGGERFNARSAGYRPLTDVNPHTLALLASELGLDLLLGWRTVRADTTVGWMLALVWLLTSLARYAALRILSGGGLMGVVSLPYLSSWCGRSSCRISRSRSISYILS